MYHGQLNDPLTHVDHCGSTLRAPVNDRLSAIVPLLPDHFMGVPVEYDVTYPSPDGCINGYRYTDFLTTCVGLYPCNVDIVRATLTGLVRCDALSIGRHCLSEMRESLTDKYLLRTSSIKPRSLVVIPGSNMLRQNVVDWDEVRKAVDAGALIKPHPVTSNPELYKLKTDYGDKVLAHDAALYPMLAECEKAYFTSSSEVGLVAAMLGKRAHVIDKAGCPSMNFSAVYEALGQTVPGKTQADKLATLLSYPQSGLFSVFHAQHTEMENWVNRFFLYYQAFPHGRNDVYSLAAA